MVRALAVISAKQTAEIGFVRVAFRGYLFQSSQIEKVLLNVCPALPISCERRGFRSAQRGIGAGDFEGE